MDLSQTYGTAGHTSYSAHYAESFATKHTKFNKPQLVKVEAYRFVNLDSRPETAV